jgi:Tfp pilus assembly protein PilX
MLVTIQHLNRGAIFSGAMRAGQQGSSLIIALIFLVIFSILVFSGVTSGILSYRMAGDMQQQREAVAAAQAVIDSRLGDATCLKNPAASTCFGTVTVGSYTVTLAAPKCLGLDLQQDPGKKSQEGVSPIPRYLWEFSATASRTGASREAVTVTQGVKMEMATGSNCPN